MKDNAKTWKFSLTEKYTKARFWKRALQVNSVDYISYRGIDHGMTEERYNFELVCTAKEYDIKVIGLADHGNVDGVTPFVVYGDAGWVSVFESHEGLACMPSESQAAFDIAQTRDKAADIQEGGKTAFNQL